MFTALGLLLSPIYLWSLMRRPLISIPFVLVFVAVFQGGAVINLVAGSSYVGISPYYFWAAAFCALITLRILVGRITPWPKALTPFAMFLLIFSAFSILTSFFLPHLFAGIPIYAPRGGIDAQVDVQQRLAYSFSNLGQSLYLFINTFIILFVASNRWTWTNFESAIKAFHASAFIAISVSIYQLMAPLAGWPFPDTLFKNNLGASLVSVDATFLGSTRLSSTFSESSTFASFLVAYIAYLVILSAGGQASIKHHVMLILAVACALASTSSTAYVTLAIFFAIFFSTYWIHPLLTRFRFKRIGATELFLIMSLLTATAATVLALENFFDILLEATTGKTESTSYMNRTASNWHALQILKETGGLGVGLGSNRPSSFATWLLSNVGIPGVIAFMLAFYFLISRTLRAAQRLPYLDRKRVLLTALVWGFMTHVLAKIVSQPDLAMPTFWAWVILIVIGLRASLADRVLESQAHTKLSQRFQKRIVKPGVRESIAREKWHGT